MNLDDDLRRVLRAYADRAPAADGLLAAARQRSSQQVWRKRTTLVLVAAFVGVVLVLVPAALSQTLRGAPAPAGDPSAGPSPTDGTIAHVAPVPLVDGDLEPPVFPFTPTSVPTGAGPPAYSYLTGTEETFHLRYTSSDRSVSIMVGSGAIGSDLHSDATSSPTQVGGRPATLLTKEFGGGQRNVAVEWVVEDGRTCLVMGTGGITAGDVMAVAEGLRPVPMPLTLGMRFTRFPAGAELVLAEPEIIALQVGMGTLTVTVESDDTSQALFVAVPGQDVVPDVDVTAPAASGESLHLVASGPVGLTAEALRETAAGITVQPVGPP